LNTANINEVSNIQDSSSTGPACDHNPAKPLERQNIGVTWLDDEAERLFAEAGLAEFADLSNAERLLPGEQVRIMREHRDKRGGGDVDRRVARLNLSGEVFYLKRSSGAAYQNIKNEFEALKVLPRFGLIPSTLAAHAFDDERETGFIILRDLKEFNSINDILLGKASPEAAADFVDRKEFLLAKVAEIIKEVHAAGYVYPDWFGKHIFVKRGSDDIALIDLERFRPLSACPWYFGFPVTSWFVRKKIARKLRRSLKSDLLSDNMLKRVFQ
jgi:hypothetical protein